MKITIEFDNINSQPSVQMVESESKMDNESSVSAVNAKAIDAGPPNMGIVENTSISESSSIIIEPATSVIMVNDAGAAPSF